MTDKYAFPEMDFESEPVYYRNGTPEVDGTGPMAFQGLTITEYKRFVKSKEWVFIGHTADGEVALGYLPVELTPGEYALWDSRIRGARVAGPEGYTDSGGTWFPGNLPNSVISAQAHAAKMEMLENSFYIHLAPKILEEEILATANYQAVQAFKEANGMAAGEKGGMRTEMQMAFPTEVLQEVHILKDARTPIGTRKEKFSSMLTALKAMRGEVQ